MPAPFHSKKPTILVTGGAGYIGAHVCKKLANEGFIPVTYDNLSTGHKAAIKWGPFVEGSLCDVATLQNAFSIYQPLAVIHLAASSIVTHSMEDPASCYRNNLVGALSLLETMQKNGVKSLVFSSTCATYGTPEFLPLTENHPQKPMNPYGKSKLMIEQMMADFDAIHGIKTIALRYFNAAGADLETEIGENHTPETHLIPSVIQTALGQRPEIIIYGADFSSSDGTAIRDYIHVEDLSSAHVASLRYLLSGKNSRAINLGTGTGHSVLQIIQAVQNYSSRQIPIRFKEKRPGEIFTLVADSTLAHTLLNWTPQYSDLPTIIESAWKWHQKTYKKPGVQRAAALGQV